MPSTEILFQGLVDNNFHLDAIKKISELENVSELIFCVSFARSEGIELVMDTIDIDLNKVKFYLGIRNGITSAQAIHEIVKKQANVFCIDTGSSGVLFHPKIYLSSNANRAYGIVGSANLTQSGLTSNIESSFMLDFDLTNEDDNKAYKSLKDSIINIPNNHPDNCQNVENARQIISMLWDGIITDERVVRKTAESKNKSSQTGSLTTPIKSFKKEIDISKRGKSKRQKRKLKQREASSNNWILVWDGKKLSRRDLAIPKNPNTHMTAQMNFTQGFMDGIDHRHYFRDEIFSELNWKRNVEENKPYKEIAKANFRLIIRGVDYGAYDLQLNHDTRTSTISYKQGNAMTKIHWGGVREFVSKEELLDCRLHLYESAIADAKKYFLIEIE